MEPLLRECAGSAKPAAAFRSGRRIAVGMVETLVRTAADAASEGARAPA